MNSLFSRKSDNGSRNRPNGPPDSKMSAWASKNIKKLISPGFNPDQKYDLLGFRNEEKTEHVACNKKTTFELKTASRQRWHNKQIRESILDIPQIIGMSQEFHRILVHDAVEHLASKS